MKRWYFGMGLLAVLLGASLLVTRGMTGRMEQVSNSLTAAANNAMVGNWDIAESLAQTAETDWQESRGFVCTFADHSPVEEIEDDLAQLDIFFRAREKTAFAATAAQLAKKVEAIGEAHALNWQNIL